MRANSGAQPSLESSSVFLYEGQQRRPAQPKEHCYQYFLADHTGITFVHVCLFCVPVAQILRMRQFVAHKLAALCDLFGRTLGGFVHPLLAKSMREE